MRRTSLALVLAVSCVGRAPQRETRTDLSPLASRLNLPPAGISDVRWVSVPEHEAGCEWIPEPDRAYRLYASFALEPAAWTTLDVPVAPSVPTTLTLPTDVARVMLPPALLTPNLPSPNTIISGNEIPKTRLSKSKHTHVMQALRIGSTLVLELLVSRY